MSKPENNFCIFCTNHLMETDDPKEGKCKEKEGYTTQNALRKLACNDYNAMPEACRSCSMRGLCHRDYEQSKYCWAFGQHWKEEEYRLLKAQLGENHHLVKEYEKIKGA